MREPRFSVRVTHHDGTHNYEHPEDEKHARGVYSQLIRQATSSIKTIELRRHEPDGTIKVLTRKEGKWRST